MEQPIATKSPSNSAMIIAGLGLLAMIAALSFADNSASHPVEKTPPAPPKSPAPPPSTTTTETTTTQAPTLQPNRRRKRKGSRKMRRNGHITKEEAIKEFRKHYVPSVVKRYGLSDKPAMRQAWNDYTDYLYHQGYISDKAVNNWVSPFA
jgi:hypothetical protein